MSERIVLGLSGGMDSAFVAIKLIEAGYDVTAVYALMHDSCDGTEEAKALAEKLGVEFLCVDARSSFDKAVITPFVADYVSGRTPNPCVLCNPDVKFNTLTDVADELGIRKVATGHYAKPVLKDGRYSFAPAADETKDQGYFLYGLSQSTLARVVMPLADIRKSEIKAYFENSKAFAFTKGESNDICFAAQGYRDIIASKGKLPPVGEYVDLQGNVLGKHSGIHNYTVGQRKGLGIALGKPAFVSDIDPLTNRIVLSFAEDCVCDEFSVEGFNYMAVTSVAVGALYKVKLRYRAKPVDCVIKNVDEKTIVAKLCVPQRFAAPGQSAVFYCEDGSIAFGGTICK